VATGGRRDTTPHPRPTAWLSWSTGKDAAFALADVRRSGACEIVGLLTTLTRSEGRVAMHGVREALLEGQARALGLPLTKVDLPYPCSNADYERAMRAALAPAQAAGVRQVVFGDLHLEDIRGYRETGLARLGMEAVFPLWGRNTKELARAMIDAGIEARVCCLDPRRLDRALVGEKFDRAFLETLPSEVDPCGENGEFHTFVTYAPGFENRIGVSVGETSERDGFVYADLVPVDR